MENALPIIVGIALVLAGPIVIYRSRRSIRAAKVATDWPTVPGQITHSEIEEFGPHPISYTCNIVYEYEHNGIKHRSDRVSFFGVFTLEEASSFTQQFTVGSCPAVYYDPDNPAFSILVPGVYGKNRTHGIAIGLLVMFAGIAVIFGVLR